MRRVSVSQVFCVWACFLLASPVTAWFGALKKVSQSTQAGRWRDALGTSSSGHGTSGTAFGQSSSSSADTEWRTYGHDPGGTRFSPLKQINNTNVQQLQRAWTYQVAPTPNSGIEAFESTPLMVDGVLYFTTQTSRALAVDAETGREHWVFDPFPGESGTRRPLPNRGAAYWEGDSPVACGGGKHQ